MRTIGRARLLLLAAAGLGAGCAGLGPAPLATRAQLPFPGGRPAVGILAGADVSPILRERASINLARALELADAKPNLIRMANEALAQSEAQFREEATARLIPKLIPLSVQFQYHTGVMPMTPAGFFRDTGRRWFISTKPQLWINPAAAYFALSATEMDRNAAYEKVSQTVLKSLQKTAGYYFALQREQALVVVTREALARAKEFLGVATAREREKVGLTVDRLWAEAEVAKRDEGVVAAEERFRVGSSMLATWLRLDPTVLLHSEDAEVRPLTFVDPSSNVGDLIETSRVNRPDMRRTDLLIAAQKYRKLGALIAPFVPIVVASLQGYEGGVGVEGGWLDSRLRARQDYYLGLHWELAGAGFADYYGHEASKTRHKMSLIDKDAAWEHDTGELVATHQAIRSRLLAIEAAQREVAAAEEGWTLALKRFEQGLAISATVLAAIEARTLAVTRLVDAITDYNTNQALLVGRLGQRPGSEGPGPAP